MIQDEDAQHHFEFLAEDPKGKVDLVIETVTQQCQLLSNSAKADSIPLLKSIADALSTNSGDDGLQTRVLSGGYTNYSYKVWLKSEPTLALYVKLALPFALWHPDKANHHYPTDRINTEFQLMTAMNTMMPENVAKPYFVVDVDRGAMKLMATEWVRSDQQLARLILHPDGGRASIHPNIATQLGEAIARLNMCQDHGYDRSLNDKAVRSETTRTAILAFIDLWRDLISSSNANRSSLVQKLFPTLLEDSSRCVARASRLQDFPVLTNAMLQNYFDRRDCLIHNDFHCYNILVTSPSYEDSGAGANYVDFTLCDWEMTMIGPRSREVGVFSAFPIAVSMAHLINGKQDAAEYVMKTVLETVQQSYFDRVKEEGLSEAEICQTHREAIGWTGFSMLFTNCFNGACHNEFMPFDGDDFKMEALRDSSGALGFSFMDLGFNASNAGLSRLEVESRYQRLIQEEFDFLQSRWVGSSISKHSGTFRGFTIDSAQASATSLKQARKSWSSELPSIKNPSWSDRQRRCSETNTSRLQSTFLRF